MLEQAQNLLAINNLKHGFFGRVGGVSKPPFASLNCSLLVNDNPTNVLANRSIACGKLSLDPSDLFVPKIVHGNDVIVFQKEQSHSYPNIGADAVISFEPGAVLGVTYADCLAILLASTDKAMVCAIHAGWRGLANGVIKNALQVVREKINLATVVAAIGPCISQQGFTFAKPGLDYFADNWPQAIKVMGKESHVDLVEIAKCQLKDQGLSNIEKVGGRTDFDQSRYFSYRRDGKNTGRHLAIIA